MPPGGDIEGRGSIGEFYYMHSAIERIHDITK